jgi:FKBP-type peptidyl-prolyl cis-trans isomerase FkpA
MRKCLKAMVGLCLMAGCASKEKKGSSFDYQIFPGSPTAQPVKDGNVVKVHLLQLIDDSVMNNTYEKLPMYVKLDSNIRQYDFPAILNQMKVGDSAVCTFPIKDIIKRATKGASVPAFFAQRKNIIVRFRVVQQFEADSLATKDYENELVGFNKKEELRTNFGLEKAGVQFAATVKPIIGKAIKTTEGVYVDIIESKHGKKIVNDTTVKVVYKGLLENSTEFEATSNSQPYVFTIGQNESIAGFEAGIAQLCDGDSAHIYVPAKLAYGANRAGEKIPPFANLIFKVRVAITNKPKTEDEHKDH